MARDGDTGAAWRLIEQWMGTVRDLEGISHLVLDWDQETLMPARGAEGRAHMAGTIATLAHRELVRADVGDALDRIDAAGDLTAEQETIRCLARRDRARALAIPEDLTRALAESTSRCTAAWHEAIRADDFAAFAAAFTPLLALKVEAAHAVGVGDEPYDALLDEYEPGARTAQLVPLFDDLVSRLRPLVDAARDRPPPLLPQRDWNVDRQLSLTRDLARVLGFDETGGVIGLTAHPFTVEVHHGDVRFSTNLDPRDPVKNILVTLHEAGHALYDQGIPRRWARTIIAGAPSYGAHESQSRFYEIHIGGTLALWEMLTARLRDLFPECMDGLDAGALRRAASAVRVSPLRLEADEVTYNLHIALRFELERSLVSGDLAVADLPGAWSDRVHDLLGVRPSGHRDGVLQDIHWASASIGYFPTYTLGNIYAAQLREALEAEAGPLEDLVGAGAFDRILAFMRERVHGHGRSLETADLMRRATGRDLGVEELMGHLERVAAA